MAETASFFLYLFIACSDVTHRVVLFGKCWYTIDGSGTGCSGNPLNFFNGVATIAPAAQWVICCCYFHSVFRWQVYCHRTQEQGLTSNTFVTLKDPDRLISFVDAIMLVTLFAERHSWLHWITMLTLKVFVWLSARTHARTVCLLHYHALFPFVLAQSCCKILLPTTTPCLTL